MMPLYVMLFNRIMMEGQILEEWVLSIIVPMYKQKGSKRDTNNLRGSSLHLCLDKLLTSTCTSFVKVMAFCMKQD